MSSETSMVTADFRIQEWAAQIRECQSRPAGMSVAGWCACHGITKANYYYRLRRVRQACLETIQGEMPAQQIAPVQPGLLQEQGQRSLRRCSMLNDATCFKAVYIVCGYTDYPKRIIIREVLCKD